MNIFMKEGRGEGGSKKKELVGIKREGYLGFFLTLFDFFSLSLTHIPRLGKLKETMNNGPRNICIYTLNMFENE